ncbi:MAG: hypothetical protein ABI899_07420, partial [Actinomycetota bacterium]
MAETSTAEVGPAELTADVITAAAQSDAPGVRPDFGIHLTPGGVLHRVDTPPFEVHLDVFQGPFELLLGLISKHKLDITEIALAT